MEITRAEYLLPLDTMRAGNTKKIIHGQLYNDLTKKQDGVIRSDSAGSGLTLSRVGQAIASLMKHSRANNPDAAFSFTDAITAVHQEVAAEGKAAGVFQEVPSGGTADRLTLAKQASNCLSVSYYGGEKIHDDISANNPFASLDRLSLSHIAFDDSGIFTSVERQVAYLEMNDRDITFRNEVYDMTSKLGWNSKVPWHDIVSNLGDAQIASAMSEAERAWQGWGTAEGLQATAMTLLNQYEVDMPSFPSYRNLKATGESVLTVATGGKGDAVWRNVPIRHFSVGDICLEPSNLITLIRNPPENGTTREALVR